MMVPLDMLLLNVLIKENINNIFDDDDDDDDKNNNISATSLLT